MRSIPAQIIAEPDEHVIFTGVTQGEVTTEDGTTYDVSEPFVAVSEDKIAEVAHLIAVRYAVEGHPADPNFVYETPEEFADYTPHENNTTLNPPTEEA